MPEKKFNLVGFASGMAGADTHVANGPLVAKDSPHFQALKQQGYLFHWDEIIKTPSISDSNIERALQHSCEQLAKRVSTLMQTQQTFCVIGGDHTSAIGTWSGVYDALQSEGDLGLIWIDAHMDSHTPETSESKRIHGMPLACLLGNGYPALTSILHKSPKLKSRNVCLIGVRSYEHGEADLLKKLNVRVYFMEEVKERGFAEVLKEAVAHVSEHTVGFGMSIDLDGLDPNDAPGVDVPEPNGINAKDFMIGLKAVAADPKLIATEIVEFDPSRDKEQKTEKLLMSLLEILYLGKFK